MNRVFISYAHSDLYVVERLTEALSANSIDVWWDKKINPGERFDREIEQQINNATLVIVLWSSNAELSEWVPNEAAIALRLNTLFPILLGGAKSPLQLLGRQSMSLALAPSDEFERSLSTVVRSIQSALNKRTPPIASHMSVMDWRFSGGFRMTDKLLSKLPEARPENRTRYEHCMDIVTRSKSLLENETLNFKVQSRELFLAFTANSSLSNEIDQQDAETALLLAHELAERYSELGRKIRAAGQNRKLIGQIRVPEYFNRVYLNTVNTFIKDILQLSSNRETAKAADLTANVADVAAGLRHIVKFARIERRRGATSNMVVGPETHAIYTLGRLPSNLPFMNIQNMLARFEEKLDKQLPEQPEKEDDFERQLRLMRRTVLLSSASLGDRASLAKYMNLMQSSFFETDINAGFHLEYYCDKTRDEQLPLSSRDDGGNCARTLEHLSASLNRALAADFNLRLHPLYLVEAYTLASIIARRLHGPFDQKVRSAMPLIEKLHARIEDEGTRIFLKLLIDVAASGPDFPDREFGRYLAAKKAPRNGWARCGVVFPETVGAHTSSVLWICKRIPKLEFPKLNVSRVRRMLEIHDLAEGITSDVVDSGPREQVDKVERALMRRFSWLGLYMDPRIDLFDTYSLYAEFAAQQTLEARVAKDVDRLDILLEGWSLLQSKATFDRVALNALVERTEARIKTEEAKFLIPKLRLMSVVSEESFRTTPDSPMRDYFFPKLQIDRLHERS
jgi:5'-deoxynucleotidase YfbR-like HD superfamily hydrolase